jgi:hypothetical protein
MIYYSAVLKFASWGGTYFKSMGYSAREKRRYGDKV